jgi:ATP-dependent DNA ligase
VPANNSRTVPTGPQWAYEIKHDGFRFLAVRHRKQVRVYSRGGHDGSERLPAIAEALKSLSVREDARQYAGARCLNDDGLLDACFDYRFHSGIEHLSAVCSSVS